MFRYDPDTGHLVWKIQKSGVRCDSRAGSKGYGNKDYERVMVHGTYFPVHRVAWFLMTGEWPDGPIDHKDGNRLNNKWENLRKATYSENSHNCDRSSWNSLGFPGVQRSGRKFMAMIRTEGNPKKYLGTFNTPEEAHQAYLEAKKKALGDIL